MMAPVDDQTALPPPRDGIEGGTAAGGWAVPGAAEEQPRPVVTPAPAGGSAPAGGGRDKDAGAGVPTVALRPMTVADILDGGFAVVKARPRRILGISALFVVPTYLLAAYLQRDSMGGMGFADFFTDDPVVLNEQTSGDQTAQLLGTLLVGLIPAIALVCVAAAVGHLVGQWMMDRDAPAGEMLGVIGRRWWPLLGSFVLVKLAEAAGLFGCYIGTLFVMALFVPVAPIIGVERCGAGEALSRSVRLTRARYFPTMGIAVLMGLVASLLGTALGALPQGLAYWIGVDEAWPLMALGTIVSEIVVLPFVAAATVLLYFDLRVRTEGLDIEMTAADVLDRAA